MSADPKLSRPEAIRCLLTVALVVAAMLERLTTCMRQRRMHKLICEEFASPDMKRPA